jgi:hypothetical protein
MSSYGFVSNTCNVTLRHVRESLLPWKSNKHYLLVYLFECACVHVGTRQCGANACSLANPACNAYAPYCDVMKPLALH